MTDRLKVSGKHRRAIDALPREHLLSVEVWTYGRRVNGRSQDGSDLDLLLCRPGLGKIPFEQLADLAEAVRESTIPFLIDARRSGRLASGSSTKRLLMQVACGPSTQPYTSLFGILITSLRRCRVGQSAAPVLFDFENATADRAPTTLNGRKESEHNPRDALLKTNKVSAFRTDEVSG